MWSIRSRARSNAVVAELNAKIAQDDRVDAAFAMVADGIAFVRKR